MDRRSLPAVARSALDDLAGLLVAQIKLVRAELASDLSETLGRARGMALSATLVLFGYGFLMAALASALSDAWGAPWGLVSVGAFHLLVGALGFVWALRFPRGLGRPLERARRELARSVGQAGDALSSHPRAASSLHG